MNIKPQKGMQEYLPEAAAQRDRLMNIILETYTASGFTRIYTPAIESAENLDKSDGGDNLNLIFRIMKRGDKLEAALRNILRYGDRIVVEEKIHGTEVTVPVLGGHCLSPIEIVPPEGSTFDYVAKYQSGDEGAREICPARISEKDRQTVCEAALKFHNALGLSVYSRSDFIIDSEGRAWCLEVNTLPGMTPNSLIPKAAKLVGLEYPQLCEEIIRLSLECKSKK